MRLVIFDIDGTLVDSQTEIMAAMAVAFGAEGAVMPPRAQVLAIVGLSLPQAFARLVPDLGAAAQARMAEAYKAAYADRRLRLGATAGGPLFPGALAALEAVSALPDTVLAVATGKSRRGLRAVLEGHGLLGVFQSLQTADDHPSKPHPGMVLACLAETGVAPARAVMVGDTSFDMDMARAAGVRSVGVTWGYHAGGSLTADRLIGRFDDLPGAVADLVGGPA
jgi:phosphoglycolate phosphatase